MTSALSRRFRRTTGVVLAAGLLSGGLALLAAPQAAATTSTVLPTSMAYIDSVLPHTSLTPGQTGDVPVGAFNTGDGRTHVSKSYFTFDLAAFKGATLTSARLFGEETTATDCTTTLATQAWLTATDRKPTWADQPAEQIRLDGPDTVFGCPAERVEWNGLTAIRNALAAGRSNVTIVLRLPDDQQSDPRFGRRYDPRPGITVTYNRLPNKPGALSVNDTACTTTPPAEGGTITLSAILTDPDNDQLTAQFAYWPVQQPDQRVELDQSAFPSTPPFPTSTSIDGPRNLRDGATYAWQVRGVDAQGPGPWSAVCNFTTDFTRPGSAPTVTSTDYPPNQVSGGTGVTGTFTFGARGVKDVVGYFYGTNGIPGTFVPTATKGGDASIRFTPDRIGPDDLAVVSVDGAGNRSPVTDYRFTVANNLPTATCTPTDAAVGEDRQCVFGPGLNTDVVSYTYQVDRATPVTVPAGQDGTATITVTPLAADDGVARISVTATLGNGITTGAHTELLFVDPVAPIVSQTPDQPVAGLPVTYTFQPVQANVVSYTYSVNSGDQVTVPADADGTATATVTPTESGGLDVQVFSTDGDGVHSGTTDQFTFVQSNRPNVSSTDYPQFTFAGGVGVPGTFTVSSPLPNVVTYTYVLNSDDPTTVPAAADGTLSLVLVPSTPDEQVLTVTGTSADGTVSEPDTYIFFVSSSSSSDAVRTTRHAE
jgi:hypothetical protein